MVVRRVLLAGLLERLPFGRAQAAVGGGAFRGLVVIASGTRPAMLGIGEGGVPLRVGAFLHRVGG